MEKDDVFRKERKNSGKKLFLQLPLPPSVNSMYTMRKQLTAKAQRFIRMARALINSSIEEQYWGVPEREEWLYVDCIFYMPDRKIRDSHNMLKLLLDVMQDTVFINDYFVLPRIQSVEYDKEFPRVEVMVTHQTKAQREKGLRSICITTG